jgi:hypothetical protein
MSELLGLAAESPPSRPLSACLASPQSQPAAVRQRAAEATALQLQRRLPSKPGSFFLMTFPNLLSSEFYGGLRPQKDT